MVGGCLGIPVRVEWEQARNPGAEVRDDYINNVCSVSMHNMRIPDNGMRLQQ